YWTHNYSIIHKTNTIIDKLKAEPALDPVQQSLYGECCMFRAYCYFNLVRAFGQVPLIDFHINSADEANRPKSDEAAIYKLIDNDLTLAEQSLPMSWEKRYTGRMTSGAAYALHARTYMQRNQWASMLASAQMVINSKQYDLKTPFNKIFREEGENSSESVWELQCTATKALPSSNEIGSQFCEVQGVRGSGDNNLGWGWHMADAEVLNAFEKGDPRKDETLLYYTRPTETWDQIVTQFGAPADGNAPYNEKLAGNDCIGRFFNKKAYCSKPLRLSYGSKSGHWFNIRLIRYSDVILMAAEASCELGGAENIKQAKVYLEEVRSRARGTAAVLPAITTDDQETLRQAIRRERRAELALEPDRFYDLVRWDIAKTVLKPKGYQARNKYLPLPQAEIDASGGKLVQNPDYAN
ncbi:MAG: RagB/SusD family nutrient uptake outer membrane protein, partial [Alistipes sp.]